jgi:hypothetical protein
VLLSEYRYAHPLPVVASGISVARIETMAPSQVKRRKKDARLQGRVVKPQKRAVKVCTEFTQLVALKALFRVAVLFWFFNIG